jgi:hypothetical protein
MVFKHGAVTEMMLSVVVNLRPFFFKNMAVLEIIVTLVCFINEARLTEE